MTSELVIRSIKHAKDNRILPSKSDQTNLLLSASSQSRVVNMLELEEHAVSKGWRTINPLKDDIVKVLQEIANARKLISENGSILFNCFLARREPYQVLSSPRIHIAKDEWIKGGYIYNSFHQSIIHYQECELASCSQKHPYADKLFVPKQLASYLFTS
jgi:capsular polysaccharide biosynthesis protein